MKIRKHFCLLLTTTLLLSSTSFAQYSSSLNNCVEQGKTIVDAFYGFPYLGILLLEPLKSGKIHNSNHLGGRVEYMISDNVGLGIESTYAKASVRKSYRSGRNILFYNEEIVKFRMLAKINIHFATTENIDPYCNFGAGLKLTNIYEVGKDHLTTELIPIAIRFGVGMRYFFNDHVGFNIEVGIGGPVMQGGLSFKF